MKCFCKVLWLIIFGSLTIASAVAAAVCWSISQHNQERNTVENTEFELLPSDTILVKHGTVSGIQFSARFESTDERPRTLEVHLIAVNCDDLIKRNSTRMGNIPIHFTEERPVYQPPTGVAYHNLESGSTVEYQIESQNVPVSSGLDIRIFNNTVEASFYKSHHTNATARDSAIRTEKVKTNTSFYLRFDAPYGSYFVATIDPAVDGGDFDVDLSYSVNRTYYSYTDYGALTLAECTLNSSKPCSFQMSDRNETCVLAYNPLPIFGNNAVILTLTTNSTKHTYHYYIHHHVFYTLLALSGIFAVLSLILLYCLCSPCSNKIIRHVAGYRRVPVV